MERLRVYQVGIFILGWIAYASTYFLRKPLGVIKADLERELSLSKSALGWLDTALLLPYAVMQMVLGPLGDKFGARKTFGFCLLLSAISMISFGNWSNLYIFSFLLFVNGTAQAQCWPNCTKALLSWFSDEVRNSVFGMFGTCAFAGGVMGTMFAVYLQSKLGWRGVYAWPSVFVIIAGVLVLLFFRTPEEADIKIMGKGEAAARGAVPKNTEVLTMWELWKIPMLKEVAIGVFCLKVVRYCMYMWLPMYLLQELQYPQHLAGILSTTFEIGGVLGSALIGFALDRFFQGRSLLGTGFSTACSAIALVLFAMTGTWGMVFNCLFLFIAGAFNAGPDVLLGGSIPAELGEQNGRNAAAATVGLVNASRTHAQLGYNRFSQPHHVIEVAREVRMMTVKGPQQMTKPNNQLKREVYNATKPDATRYGHALDQAGRTTVLPSANYVKWTSQLVVEAGMTSRSTSRMRERENTRAVTASVQVYNTGSW